VPKREKARILAAMQQSSSSRSHERAVTAELEDEGRLMTTVIRAHIETCDFTQDKIRPVLQQARENPSFCAPSTLVSLGEHIFAFQYIYKVSVQKALSPKVPGDRCEL